MYRLHEALARPYPVSSTGLVVAGAVIFKGATLRETGGAAGIDMDVSDGASAAQVVHVLGLHAANGASATPIYFGGEGILLERGCFVTFTGAGVARAAVWLIPATRDVAIDSPYAADLYGQVTQ